MGLCNKAYDFINGFFHGGGIAVDGMKFGADGISVGTLAEEGERDNGLNFGNKPKSKNAVFHLIAACLLILAPCGFAQGADGAHDVPRRLLGGGGAVDGAVEPRDIEVFKSGCGESASADKPGDNDQCGLLSGGVDQGNESVDIFHDILRLLLNFIGGTILGTLISILCIRRLINTSYANFFSDGSDEGRK